MFRSLPCRCISPIKRSIASLDNRRFIHSGSCATEQVDLSDRRAPLRRSSFEPLLARMCLTVIRYNTIFRRVAAGGTAALALLAAPAIALVQTPAPSAPSPAPNADGSTNARPLGSIANWVAMEDLPSAAMAPGINHAVRVRLSVSPLGFVDGCTVLASSGDANVDSAVCTALQRNAFFTPAMNAAGQAIAGEYVRNVRWAPPPAPTAPAGTPPAQ